MKRFVKSSITLLIVCAFALTVYAALSITGISSFIWDVQKQNVQTMTFKGAAALSGTLDNAAAVDAGSGAVTIPMTGHGFLDDSWIYLQGTTNYDGFHLVSGVAANTFNITDTYVAETFAGTEYAGVAIGPREPKAWRIQEVRLTLSDTSADEAATLTLDSSWGSQFDNQFKSSESLNGLKYWVWSPGVNLFNEPTDIVKVVFANTNTRTFGFEVKVVVK